MRARYPDEEGYVDRDGVRIHYEVHGGGSPTLVLVPCVAGADARSWKAQIHYLARRYRVVAFDPRGRGQSDRPRGPEAYTADEHARDLLEVMASTDTDRALLISHCIGARPALSVLTGHPGLFAGSVFISPYLVLTRWPPVEIMWRTFECTSRGRRTLHVCRGALATAPLLVRSRSLRRFARRVRWFDADEKFNAAYMLRNQRGFLEWNARVLELTQPHSTRQIEDSVGWAMETDARTQVDGLLGLDVRARAFQDRRALADLCRRVACPVHVIHGTDNLACPPEWGDALAAATRGSMTRLGGSGHIPQGRHPVAVNLALRDFVDSVHGVPTTAGVP